MKKAGIFLITGLLVPMICLAQSRTGNGLSDAEKLAITAGAAQACKADQDKLINYEVIVSRILVNPTTTEQEETAVLTAYARKKFQVYTEQKESPEMDCTEVLRRFDNLEIFKSVVYQDGTVKLPDGKVIKPKRPVHFETNTDQSVFADQKSSSKAVKNEEKTPAKKSTPLKPFHPKTIVNSAAK